MKKQFGEGTIFRDEKGAAFVSRNRSCFSSLQGRADASGGKSLLKKWFCFGLFFFLLLFICVPQVHRHAEANTSRYLCSANRKIKVKIITDSRKILLCLSSFLPSF